jgi:hypothetical protein
MAKEKNGVSIWFWMFAIIVSALPCVGLLFAIIFAFVGENETRKNYFKASLILQIFAFCLVGMLVTLGFAPVIWDLLQRSADYWPRFLRGE